MSSISANPALLYLNLLTHEQLEVRQQAVLLMAAHFGDRALTLLRRLLDSTDPAIRNQARRALAAFGETLRRSVRVESYENLYIETLGRLRVYIGSREITPQDWMQNGGRAGWQKLLGVFAYLLHCGRRGASRQAIGEAVWGGTVSSSSLARTLSGLRQVLADIGGEELIERALVITPEHCLLDPQYYMSDSQLFERTFDTAVQTEQHEGLEEALPLYQQAYGLYGGPYMVDAPRGNTWGGTRRELLRSNFVIVAERLAEHAFLRERFRDCALLCEQVIDIDEDADDILVWLLRAYDQLGQHAELEHVFRRYLQSSSIDINNQDPTQDLVVQAYHSLTRVRVVAE